MLTKQQALADERFVWLEDERVKQELEVEERRRRENRQHEFFIMQMMGTMFSQIA